INISLYNNNQINNRNNETDLIKLNNNNKKESDDKVKMLVSSSISKSGILWNITDSFSKEEFLMSEINPTTMSYNLILEVKPTKNVVSGNYTLTISARYENIITYSKILDMIIR
ncbi:MAG TPA: hypothetical protein VLA74_02760, partial [Nitrososphaeraceae archaeon]|nr:hypothetical protein [Nitrososphaeraceae archaeon]